MEPLYTLVVSPEPPFRRPVPRIFENHRVPRCPPGPEPPRWVDLLYLGRGVVMKGRKCTGRNPSDSSKNRILEAKWLLFRVARYVLHTVPSFLVTLYNYIHASFR